MADELQLDDPWLVAVWPGMGNVALAAGTYLVEQLEVTPLAQIPSHDHFDINHVDVSQGIAEPGRLPRNMFFAYKTPAGQRDLLIFVGEAQPNSGGYAFCNQLLDLAQRSTEIVAASELEAQTLEVFTNHSDKRWSVVDCANFVCINERRSRWALAFDRDFAQAQSEFGFTLLGAAAAT